ncbi:cell division control 45 family protein [Actinomadura rupiterrae]|uniref:cell division control 45 family protein n=1 Tax=Actinomadura rupiterrae TaxID=559627 RepID=UPI0020A394C2|nr:cell division control 45 family protein [Actinomadura rupiterrae]
MIKLLIALDRLEKGDDPLLRPMLRSSDDAAASELWRRNGRGAIVTRMAREIGLAETAPPPAAKPGFWGYSALSAADVVKIYRYLLEKAPARSREVVMGHLRHATRCGTDHFDQYFGIPRAVKRPWAVKQGWSGYGDAPGRPCAGGVEPVLGPDLGIGRPVLHTTGVVGDKIVAVLTLQPAGTSFEAASKQLTGLTGEVLRASGG